MKRISIISTAIFTFLFGICNSCFADVVDPGRRRNEVVNNVANKAVESSDSNVLLYVIIGALIAVVVVCAILCIISIVNKKKVK